MQIMTRLWDPLFGKAANSALAEFAGHSTFWKDPKVSSNSQLQKLKNRHFGDFEIKSHPIQQVVKIAKFWRFWPLLKS